jgi:O-antigen/teichoic acid export membrane protein
MSLNSPAALAWGLSQAANALNVLAGIIIARTVSPTDFGRFATLSAALAIMTAVLNPLINEIAERFAIHRAIAPKAILSRSLLAIVICCTIARFSCASIVNARYEAALVYLLIPTALVGHSWITGVLYGLHRMITASALLCASSLLRIFILVLALFAFNAPFLGTSLSYLAYFIVTIAASGYLLTKEMVHSTEVVWRTNWRLICGFFLLALPFSVDQPIIQRLFPESSADYAALMTYAKSLVLLASPALTLVYSAELQRSAAKHTTQRSSMKFTTSLSITAGLVCSLALVLWILRPFLFPLLLGAKYLHVIPYLGLALIGMALYVIAYFLIQRLLISCKGWLLIALATPPLAQCILLTTQNTPSITRLTSISIVVFTIQCSIALIAAVIDQRRELKIT